MSGRNPGLLRWEVPQRSLASPELVNVYSGSVNNSLVALRANPPHASHTPQSHSLN